MKIAVAVAINVHQENARQVEECITRVRNHLSPSSLGVFINGMQRPDLHHLFVRSNAQTILGENYGNNTFWNLWWLRMLKWFGSTDAEVCFKFDPDTMVDARPQLIPSDDYFGDVHRSKIEFQRDRHWGDNSVPFVQGGILGLSRTAVNRLLASELLEAACISEWCPSISVNLPFMDDHLIAAALRQLSIPPRQWGECKSRWKVIVPNDPISHSVVHPRYYT
jgi:hypothetical protein